MELNLFNFSYFNKFKSNNNEKFIPFSNSTFINNECFSTN